MVMVTATQVTALQRPIGDVTKTSSIFTTIAGANREVLKNCFFNLFSTSINLVAGDS